MPEKPKIDYSKENKNLDEIKINDSFSNTEDPVKLSGLYDPEKNDLNLNMWSNTNGEEIEKIRRYTTFEIERALK